MYHFVVRQILLKGYRDLSSGNYEAVLSQFAPDVHFRFYGDHALGADLHEIGAVRAWFQRTYRIFPGLQFRAKQIVACGMPWDTHIAAQFTVSVQKADGQVYENTCAQFLRLRWGKIVEDYVLEDTQTLVRELEWRGKQGIAEAQALPIMG